MKSLTKNSTGYVRSPPYTAPSTMSNPSSVYNPDLQSAKDKIDRQDDMSDATHPIGTNVKANAQKMISKVLKFSFVYTGSTKHKVAPSVIHTHWMQAVQDAFGTDIVRINNKNQNVETVSTLKWTDPSIHAKQFKLSSENIRKCRATHVNILPCPSSPHLHQFKQDSI